MPDQHDINTALAFLGYPIPDLNGKGVPWNARPRQMEDYDDIMQEISYKLSTTPGVVITCFVKTKEDGHSVSIECNSLKDGEVTIYHRTEIGKECIKIPSSFLPEWAIHLGAKFSAEAHGTLNGEPLGFYKVISLLSKWRKGEDFPPGLRLHLSVFELQSLFTGSEQNGGRYDDKTREHILSKIVPNSSQGMIVPITAIEFDVWYCAERRNLLFRDVKACKVVAEDHQAFRIYLRQLARGTEGFVIKFPNHLLTRPDAKQAWFEDSFGKIRLNSMCKIRDTNNVEVVVTKAIDDDSHDRFMLWTRRGDRLEYAGTPSQVMMYHLKQGKNLKPFMRVDGKKGLTELYERGLQLSFLEPEGENYCIQVLISASWITNKGHVTGVKATSRIITPHNPDTMEDTLEVARKGHYWKRVNAASNEFDRLFTNKNSKRKRELSPFKGRDIPIPPPAPLSSTEEGTYTFACLLRDMARDTEAWMRERVEDTKPIENDACKREQAEEAKVPEDFYGSVDPLAMSPSYHDEDYLDRCST